MSSTVGAMNLIGKLRAASQLRSILGSTSKREFANISNSTFSSIDIELSTNRGTLPPADKLVFGKIFTDHMARVDWQLDEEEVMKSRSVNDEDQKDSLMYSGWGVPKVMPFGKIDIHPASQCLHYGSEIFEGMKAYRSEKDDTVALFRPDLNAKRLRHSARSLGLPYVPEDSLIQLIKQVVSVDHSWVPSSPGCSLYIRPFIFGTSASAGLTTTTSASLMILLSPVGRYFKEGLKPISLLLDDKHVRAWPGGVGHAKAGGNYAPTLKYQGDAMLEFGCSQVLYALPKGDDENESVISEAGAMNVFILIEKEDGGKELVTAPLDGTILPGVTRQSVIDICKDWKEFEVSERLMTVRELKTCAKEGRLLEIFGCGTAVLICPVNEIKLRSGDEIRLQFDASDDSMISNRVLTKIEDIQYGRIEGHPWNVKVQ